MFGGEALAPAELYSLITKLPDDSAFARVVAATTGRYLPQDLHRAAELNLLHQVLDVTIQAATGGKGRAPAFEEFLSPAAADPEPSLDPGPPAKPRTMSDWLSALGAFSAGVPMPPERGGEQ